MDTPDGRDLAPGLVPAVAADGSADSDADSNADSAAAVQADAWEALRRFTPARIALGRAGASLPTRALLEFGLAQARARDAVHEASQQGALLVHLTAEGYSSIGVHSAAADRQQYLRRPDLGRRLDAASRERLLQRAAAERTRPRPDVVFVVADGLSPQAAARHALPLLRLLDTLLCGWNLGPVLVADMARVALGDEIGALLGARQVVMLIGERPGLSAPDSLGIYLTHTPRIGRTDAERNCISNVRPDGLGYADAARRLRYLLAAAQRLGRTGVDLKDESAGSGSVASVEALREPPQGQPLP
jgi:ethanolamine ammonia-lyase small subunit